MTPELRDLTRNLHFQVGTLRPHNVVQVPAYQLHAIIAAAAAAEAEVGNVLSIHIEAGQVLRLLNLILAADLNATRLASPAATLAGGAPAARDSGDTSGQPISAATAD
jgi:hypothetical protein